MPEKILKDISKIQFDFENCETGINPDWVVKMGKSRYHNEGFSNYPCGYKVLENNLPVLFVNAGGDWESPICFIIYWDGKSLRGYVPTKGNVFNKKTKAAYGNEYDFDQEEIDDDEIPEANNEEIVNDIINRIKIK